MLNILALKTGAKQFHYGTIPLRLIRCGLHYQEPPDQSVSPSAAPRGTGAPCLPAAVLRERGGSQGALQASEPGAPALPRSGGPGLRESAPRAGPASRQGAPGARGGVRAGSAAGAARRGGPAVPAVAAPAPAFLHCN